MDIFKTYAQNLSDQLDDMTVGESKKLDLYGKDIFYFRPYLTRYQKDSGKQFKTKKHEDEYFIKRIA